MTDAEIAWLAGIVEGEGCIAFPGVYSTVLTIGMTDKDVIDRCHALVGAGARYVTSKGRHKPQYIWKLADQHKMRELLALLLPWMGERRSARIREAFGRLEKVRRTGRCRRDHQMSGDNLYVSPGGQRMCRACADFRHERDRAVNESLERERARDRLRNKTEKRRARDRERRKQPKQKAQQAARMARYLERQKAMKAAK